MPSILNLAASLRRVRHGRGFGIHSPFAYRFVTEVLRLPDDYGYYAYLYIARQRMRVLFRVAVHFCPREVAFIGCEDNSEVRKAVFSAVSRAAVAPIHEADMVVFDAAANRKLPADAIPPTAVTVILAYKRWKNYSKYLAALPCGMSFANRGSMAVVVPLSYLPRQDFEIRF